MLAVPERSPAGGLGRMILATVAYVLVAPVGLLALPVAALGAVTRSRSAVAAGAVLAAGGVGVVWLLQQGDPPDQAVRAVAVLATAAFLAVTVVTHWATVHRALLAAGVAGVGVTALGLMLGRTWDALHWWVQFRTGAALRLVFGLMWAAPGGVPTERAAELAEAVDTATRLMADLFPAVVALQLLVGLVLAMAWHRRLAREPLGRPAARFMEFRFSEHLGWLLVLPLAWVLVPGTPPGTLAAWNVMTVMAVLYVLRGLAVAVFGFRLSQAGPFLAAMAGIAVIFLWFVFLPGALVLGVLDTGLDLRRRWTTPSNNG